MRLCPHPSPIHSDPEGEVWHYINRLTSFNYVCLLLKERLEKHFFGFRDHIDKLTKAKLIHNTDNPNGADSVEIHQILSENNDIDLNGKEITLLARILFLSTCKSEKAIGRHGMSLKDDKSRSRSKENNSTDWVPGLNNNDWITGAAALRVGWILDTIIDKIGAK